MIKKTWMLCLYNLKREFRSSEDLQNMISVSEELDGTLDTSYQRQTLKKYLLSINKLSEENVRQLRIERSLLDALGETEAYVLGVSNIQKQNFNKIMNLLIETQGEFAKTNKMVELSDTVVDYDYDKFVDSFNEMKKNFSLNNVLNFVYGNELFRLSYKKMTGRETEYNDIRIIKPLIETLNSSKVAETFSDTNLSMFYELFSDVDKNGSDEEFINEVDAINENYIDLKPEMIINFKNARKVLIDSYVDNADEYERIVRSNLNASFSDKLVNVAQPLYKLLKHNKITMGSLYDMILDFYMYLTVPANSKLGKISDDKVINQIKEELNKTLFDLLSKEMNMVIESAEKLRKYENETVKQRVSRANNFLVSTVIEKW